MAQPTIQDVHVNVPLSNVAIAYQNATLIGDQVAPVVPVSKVSDSYYVFDRGAWFRDTARKRAPGTRAARSGFTLSTTSFHCEEIALATEMSDEERDNADSVIQLERRKVEYATDLVLLSREIAVASALFTAGNWTNSAALSGSDRWDDAASTPIKKVRDIKTAISGLIGRDPNTMVMGRAVWDALMEHPDPLDRIKYTQRGILSTELLAALMGIPKVLVGNAIKTTSPEGTAEASLSFSRVWGKSVWIGYVSPTPAKDQPSALYVFRWRDKGLDIRVKRWREEAEHQTVYEAAESRDIKVTSAYAGYLLTTVVS